MAKICLVYFLMQAAYIQIIIKFCQNTFTDIDNTMLLTYHNEKKNVILVTYKS
jgi:hypothetical protein